MTDKEAAVTAPGSPDYFSTGHLKADLRTRALRGATATIAAQAAAFGIQTVGTILLARLLSPDDFGLVTMVLTVSLLLQNFGVNGFTEAVIKTQDINHRQISTLFWINAALSLTLAVLFAALAPAVAWFYNEPRLKSIVAAIALSIVFAGLSTQHMALLKRGMQFSKLSLNDVVAALVSVAIPILLALHGAGYWALVAKWIILPLVSGAGAWLLCSWRPGLPGGFEEVRPLIRFAFHTYGNFMMNYLRRNMDKMLIGRNLGSLHLGSYDRAYQLSNMLPVQIMGPLNSVSLAAFSRLSDEPARYRETYLKLVSLLAFVGMPLSAALTLISDDVILLLLGPRWSGAAAIFRAFGPSIGITILYLTHGWLHLSLGTPDRWFRWSIVELVVTGICLLAGLLFGAVGVAVGYSVSFYLLVGPALWYAGRPVQLTLSSILAALWKYFLAALIAGFGAGRVLTAVWAAGSGASPLVLLGRIAGSVLLCLSFYLVLVIMLFGGTKPINQFIALVREMISQKRTAA